MKRKLFATLCALSLVAGNAAKAQYSVYGLACEGQADPLGIDAQQPRFGWKLQAQERGTEQAAYQVMVADSEERLAAGEGNVWNSGRVSSANSVVVGYGGKPLKPATTYYWRVQSWSRRGESSGWSRVARFTTGLPTEADWAGSRWIAMEKDGRKVLPGIHSPHVKRALGDEKTGMYRLPMMRRVVRVKKPVSQALAFVCGLGQFDMFVNGSKAGDHFLDPGWTQYAKEALYVTFDLTDSLRVGDNVVGVMLGGGFYNIPRERYFKLLQSYGAPKMRLKLVIRYEDGSEETVVSDKSWRVAESPVTYSSIYGGEDYDATREQPGWCSDAAFDDSRWAKAVEVEQPIRLVSQAGSAVAVRDVLPVQRRFKSGEGRWVYDLGQNFAGIVRLKVRSGKSAKVVLRPGELLGRGNAVTQRGIGGPFYFAYTTRGDGAVEQWQPQFTYYGFRYVQVEGAVPAGEDNPEGLPEIVDIEGLHTCNNAAEAGTFACSKPLFNQTYNLIDWAMRSNMASLLTDCPHREKLGWQEQSHLMQYSMQYRFDMRAIYADLMDNMAASQLDNGCIPTIAPEYVRFEDGFEDTPEWGSSFIICPWYFYKWYGDRSLIERHYPAMQRYLDYLTSRSDGHIVAYGLGDWFDIGPKKPGKAQLTSNALTATAIYYYDTKLMADMARLLGKDADAQRYAALAAEIRAAYNAKFLNKADSTYERNSQTASGMSLCLGLVEPGMRGKVERNLAADIAGRDYALTAGDVGYRYVVQALQAAGMGETIFRMNSKYDVPGYGWQLAHGATALTESWQAYNDVSNNHLMLGHLMEWFFGGLGGIRQSEESVAFSDIIIDPQEAGDVTWATTAYESVRGRIECSWRRSGGRYTLRVAVPAGCRATVTLSTADPGSITEYGRAVSGRQDIRPVDAAGGKSRWAIGSGEYLFEVETK